MNIFKRLFARGKDTSPDKTSGDAARTAAQTPASTNQDASKDPNLIKVYDAYGRELFITRQEWRLKVLPEAINRAWNNPDELYGTIVGALDDGFRADIVRAAQHLYETDPDHVRGSCLWGIVLMEEERLDQAQKIFQTYIDRHGEQGVILTNLAKVHAARGDGVKAEAVLRRALEVDPNQDNGLLWHAAIHRERGGEAAYEDSLRAIGSLPGSWRAQLWLARNALKSGQAQQALAYYEQSLERAGKPAPADLLMQISGDLGNHGRLAELLQIVEPQFDATLHGLQVGNNLVKAYVELGNLERAKELVDTLFAQNRPDWDQTLKYWDREIAKRRVAAVSFPADQPLDMIMMRIDGPIWLRADSPAARLFRLPADDAPWVCFLGSSAQTGNVGDSIRRQLSDGPGRLSRALPLFLAEQTEFHTQARTRTLVPWIINPPGFVLAGKPWNETDVSHLAREGSGQPDYLVAIDLVTAGTPWQVMLRLVRTIDGTCLSQFEERFNIDDPEEAFTRLASRLHSQLQEHAGILPRPSSSPYSAPEGPWLAEYLLRLEQLLAVRCSLMDGASGFLDGEREILDGNIRLCVACEKNVAARVLLAQTVATVKKIRSHAVRDAAAKLTRLQHDKPLPEPAHGVVQQLLAEAMAS